MATPNPRKAGNLKLGKFSASQAHDKRRRNKSYINPRELYAAANLHKQAHGGSPHHDRRSRSNIDARDVHAAEELRQLQQTLWRTETRSRCNSLSSTGSAGSHQNLIALAALPLSPDELARLRTLAGPAGQSGHEVRQRRNSPGAYETCHQRRSSPASYHHHQLSPPGYPDNGGHAAVDVAGLALHPHPHPPAEPSPQQQQQNAQLSLAERAALAYPFPHRHRRKLPQTPGGTGSDQQPPHSLPQQSPRGPSHSPPGPGTPDELLPGYPTKPGAAGMPFTGGLEMPVHVLDCDALEDRAPLRVEETSFEGVTMAHLKQLEELQLQRQMLLQAEARLKMTLGGVGPPPAGMELPSYDQAMPTGPPPPFPTMMVNSRSHPHGMHGQLHHRAEDDGLNADDLSMLLQASC